MTFNLNDLRALRDQFMRPASRMTVGGFRPPDDPFASWFGKVMVGRQEEIWPLYNDEPMLPLCQIRLSDLPFIPPELADSTFLTLFVPPGRLPEPGSPNGSQWQIRTYGKHEPVELIEPPSFTGDIRPFPVRWDLVEDYPPHLLSDELDGFPSFGDEEYRNLYAEKIPEIVRLEDIDESALSHNPDALTRRFLSLLSTRYCSKFGAMLARFNRTMYSIRT